MKRILVPVDLSPFSAKSVTYAAELAQLTGASLTLLTVINDVFPYFDFFPVEYAAPDYFQALRQKTDEEIQTLARENARELQPSVEVRRGYPANEIVTMAKNENFDLIVMATHGHSGIEHALLGSITEKVLRKAHCPVLVVR